MTILPEGVRSAGAPLSNKPPEADRSHGDEPYDKLRPPSQHGDRPGNFEALRGPCLNASR